ncbi:phosphate regulon sensor histidine kinase PhoR [Advenella alkanexedens]|uniref:phosphate regulon sensor histidine kinase PhoR n=1 Tax=Advenella alkanexedens TaxID=1481665 RepID=UPI002675E1B8|nr:phosphate regulon sensor histidine kinase PhoR [Advenella alkanexedens]WKU19309.1 phosphate regulon sensor histidine kinase PhoR [Advenella alkanexedens]
MRWIKPLLWLCFAILFCIGIQYLTQGYWGIISLGLIFAAFYYLEDRHFQLTANWAHDAENPPPPDLGKYDDIVTPIYKLLRFRGNELTSLRHLSHSVLSAAQALPAAAITLDRHFHIEWCNGLAEKMLGLSYAQDKGYNIFNLVRLPEFFEYAQNGDWSKSFVTHMESDGQFRCLKFDLNQYSEEGILMLCQDITQLEKLRTTQQDFVANVSHEIRTPLTVLIGFLETLQDLPPEAVSPEQRKHYETLMHEQAQRMLAIVADLLTLSTLESTQASGGQKLVLAQLIESAGQLAHSLSKGKHKFIFEIDEKLAIHGQQTEISSAISNLMTNAVRYTPSDGTITVSWRKDDKGNAVFSVHDTGLGIAKQDIPRITERFYRVDKSRSRASGGTGLGLAITKHVVIRHNAKLVINSEINKGSTFSIVFPPDSIINEPNTRSPEKLAVHPRG